MQAEPGAITRKEFLLALAAVPAMLAARPDPGKLLIVVAHPDDEYAFAAATYRLVRELGWIADQVVITDGEAGYRYSALAEAFYGKPIASGNLAAIRKEEAIRAGSILGIRQHSFLDQKDLGFTTNAAKADSSNWDRTKVLDHLGDLLAREHYDAVFTLLPTAETHGHHRAATALAQEAVGRLSVEERPVLVAVEPRSKQDPALRFQGREPSLVFDRTTPFGYQNALNYQIVVNWVIAEHKSQGLFQMDCGKHELEEFWVLDGAAKWPLVLSALDSTRRYSNLENGVHGGDRDRRRRL
jgi:LmbE family N-acetylglucosaminyl deacetylase